MEKTLISWSVPNLITIWLMLAIGFLVMTLGVQVGGKFLNRKAAAPANNSGGY